MKENHIDVYDTTVAVWEEIVDLSSAGRDLFEQSFRQRVFVPVQKFLGRRGWKITADPYIRKHYRCLSKDHRLATKGELLAGIELSGRYFKVEIWQDKYNVTHPGGGKYECQKRAGMPYLLGLRCDLEMGKLVDHLQTILGYPVTDRRYRGELASEIIDRHIKGSGHYKPDLGHAAWHGDWNRRSADGKLLDHGQTVWFYSEHGRLLRGQAFYSLNNMWWVKINRFEVTNQAAFSLYVDCPLKHKDNTKLRRERLESEIARAVESMRFGRAERLKAILFGGDKLYRIWARDKSSWYRTAAAGYTNNTVHAGLYREDEALRLVGGMGKELEMRPVA